MTELGTRTIAILLPLVTRVIVGNEGAYDVPKAKQRVTDSMERLLVDTQLSEEGSAARARLYIGVDEGDYFSTPDGLKFLDDLLKRYTVGYEVLEPFAEVYHGKLCRIWAKLADQAYKDGHDFMVLLGDDVTILTYDWLDRVERAYADLALEMFPNDVKARSALYGFGCVCFADLSFPNFPTFPVLHRLHYEIMGGEIFPSDFENQDADPFLFELYKRFDASRILKELKLVNGIGGLANARYIKKHITWKDKLLDDAVDKVRNYLVPWQEQLSARSPSIDVIVPAYRCDLDILKRICQLPVANKGTLYIIIVDRPEELDRVRTALEELPSLVRVRANEENLGASASRNHGLYESAAEYVVLFDDDVQPEENTIVEYSKALQEWGDKVDGLIGNVKFPPMKTLHEMAIRLSDVNFMFGIAEVLPTPRWGVTANLLLKRKQGIRFGTDFPKTGGGEDIDICLRYNRSDGTSPFRGCPTAVVTHPWWPDDGHFAKWAQGDGRLLRLYPQHTYLNFPNVAESVVLAVVMPLFIWWPSTVAGVASDLMRMMGSSVAVILSEMLSDVIKHCIVDRTRAVDEIRGLTRVKAAAWSSLIILRLEMSRLRGHLSRWEFTNFMWRFDWHCGQMEGGVMYERVVAGLKLVMHIVLVTLFHWSFALVSAPRPIGSQRSEF